MLCFTVMVFRPPEVISASCLSGTIRVFNVRYVDREHCYRADASVKKKFALYL